MRLIAKVRGAIQRYGRLLSRPHRKATFISAAVIGATCLALAGIEFALHPSEAQEVAAGGLAWLIFLEALFIYGRQVWITDDYDRAAAAAAEAERVRQQAQREREARKAPVPSIASSYAILGLNVNANEAEIRTAFRRLVKRFHPDSGWYTRTANAEKFRRVQEAYAEIRNLKGF